MLRVDKLKPDFWDHEDVAGFPHRHLFNFRRIWKRTLLATAGVALIPLILLSWINYREAREFLAAEAALGLSARVSKAGLAVSDFIATHRAALDFVGRDNSPAALEQPERLRNILEHLQAGFGGFVDLEVIDAGGRRRAYAGPFDLAEEDFQAQVDLEAVLERGFHVSEVLAGLGRAPHLVISVRRPSADGIDLVLCGAVAAENLTRLLAPAAEDLPGDTFIINEQGILQTPSRAYGKILAKASVPLPAFSGKPGVRQAPTPDGQPMLIAHAQIPETPFIVMAAAPHDAPPGAWGRARNRLLWFLALSVAGILFVTLAVATYLVENLHAADQKRLAMLHQVEYSNKMAAIGRLGASIAHEINNPLAIIQEKAGLIKDLVTLRPVAPGDPKLLGLIDSITASVERCAGIARRLQKFIKTGAAKRRPVDLVALLGEVIGFFSNEAIHRSIEISLTTQAPIPTLESDPRRLQEIFINLVNHAFGAMDDGGRLEVRVRALDGHSVLVTVTDTGCGIPEKDLARVFEPFFSARTRGGIGLGLSITYSLVAEIGGRIQVESRMGEGTSFILTFPLRRREEEEKAGCPYPGEMHGQGIARK